MTLLLAGFFIFTMLAITGAGLVYQCWAAASDAETSDVSGTAATNDGEDAGSSSWVAGLLVSLGRVAGSRQKDDGLRSLLFRAGYRSPAAVAMFHGARVASGVVLAVILDWVDVLQRSNIDAPTLGIESLPAAQRPRRDSSTTVST